MQWIAHLYRTCIDFSKWRLSFKIQFALRSHIVKCLHSMTTHTTPQNVLHLQPSWALSRSLRSVIVLLQWQFQILVLTLSNAFDKSNKVLAHVEIMASTSLYLDLLCQTIYYLLLEDIIQLDAQHFHYWFCPLNLPLKIYIEDITFCTHLDIIRLSKTVQLL